MTVIFSSVTEIINLNPAVTMNPKATLQYFTDPKNLDTIHKIKADLQALSAASPPIMETLRNKAVDILGQLEYNMQCLKISEEIAKSARKNPKEAIKKLLENDLIIDNFIISTVGLIYEGDSKNLMNCIEFVNLLPRGSLSMELRLQAIQQLYSDIIRNNHNTFPDILRLESCLNDLQPENDGKDIFSDIKDQIESESCTVIRLIASEIVNGETYSQSQRLIAIGLLQDAWGKIMQMIQIMKKSPVLLTLRIIKFAALQPDLTSIATLIESLHSILSKDDDKWHVEALLHVWSFVKHITQTQQFLSLDGSDPTHNAVSKIFKDLCKHTHKYVAFYKNIIERSDCTRLDQLHCQNEFLKEFIPIFVDSHYDGELDKVNDILRACQQLRRKCCSLKFLQKLGRVMSDFGQDETDAKFAFYCTIKSEMGIIESINFEDPLLKKFQRLKKSAPPCIAMILWPDEFSPHGITISCRDDLLLSLDMKKVVCGKLKTVEGRHPTPVWKAAVDTKSGLVCFKMFDNQKHLPVKYLVSTHNSKGHLGLSEASFGWKVIPLDQEHINIYSMQGIIFTHHNTNNYIT